MQRPPERRPHVVIVGAGFAGLEAARALRDAPIDVTVVDRSNHHVFQPLLYQVATAVLPPSDIAIPIRTALRDQRNVTVLLGEVTGVDLSRRALALDEERDHLRYDFLVVAAGARHAYFGHPEWSRHAPGLKTLYDALDVRSRLLTAFERAERAPHGAALPVPTIVVVGGGPTGVELAGSIVEMARGGMAREFRRLDTRLTRVLLLEGGPRLLPALAPELSARARRDLEAMGVEVRTGSVVTRVADDAVWVGAERIPASAVLWGAGIEASPLGRTLGTTDRVGRVFVRPDLSLSGHPEVFVAGDLACVPSAGPVPVVAAAAIQMGRAAAHNIRASVAGIPRVPFRYRDRGSLAIIGPRSAVGQLGRMRLGGSLAASLWGIVHLLHLVGHRNRLRVLAEWSYAVLSGARGDRLFPAERVAADREARRVA